MPDLTARISDVRETLDGLSEDARHFFSRVSDEILDFAEDRQLTPREIVAALGVLLGGLALTDAQNDPDDNYGFDDFLEFSHAGLHVGAAQVRISAGWKPEP